MRAILEVLYSSGLRLAELTEHLKALGEPKAPPAVSEVIELEQSIAVAKAERQQARAMTEAAAGARAGEHCCAPRHEQPCGIQQQGGLIAADQLRAVSQGAGDVKLESANVINRFAGQSGGALTLRVNQALNIGTVQGSTGVQSAGRLDIRAAGDLGLDAAVSSAASGDLALVLASGRAFQNRAGAQAVTAPAGRWLIYDINPTQ